MKTLRNLMRHTLWSFLALALVASARSAAVGYFLEIEGVEGESQDDKHKNQIEILSYSWGAQSVIDPTSGAGKFVDTDFEILKTLDKSSPKLAEACAKGTHFPKAIITVRKSGERQVEIVLVRYIFEEVFISGHHISFQGAEDRPMESVSFNFAKVGVEYFTISPLGTVGTREAFAWDFVLNGVTTLVFPTPIDADGDTMLDDWERAFGLDPTINDARLDKDDDGATNEEEHIAGTDPSSADKVFKATLNFTPGARTAALTFPTAPDRNYRIMISPSLDEPFQPYLTIPSSGEPTTTINVPGLANLNQFYRIEIVP